MYLFEQHCCYCAYSSCYCSCRKPSREGVGTATHAAVVIVRATLAALSFVSHSPTAVAAVVVSSPLHILVQQVLRPLERQLLMVRPGFEPQACRAPTRRGIYLFSVIVDTSKVCSTCTAAEPLTLLPLLLFVLCLPWPVLCLLAAHAHGRSQLIDEACACYFALRLKELGPR